MSLAAFDRQRAALAIQATGPEKHVLLVLATRGDEQGRCTPGIPRIASDTGLSERTVLRAVASLETAGHITRHVTEGVGTVYIVHPRPSVTPDTESPLTECHVTPDTESPKQPRTPIPQKATPSSVARKAADPGAYHRLPEDWRPTRQLPLRTQAKVAQWPPGKYEDELANIRRWAANASNDKGKGRKLDWDMAFVNWLEKADNDWRPRNGRQLQQPANDGLGPTVQAALHAKRILDERARHV